MILIYTPMHNDNDYNDGDDGNNADDYRSKWEANEIRPCQTVRLSVPFISIV